MALAALDHERLDRELFYCAALVHDWGATVQFRARTSRSGEPSERWLRSGRGHRSRPSRADRRRHLLPHDARRTVRRDGAIAYYVQYGAMVDGAGLRAWDVAPRNIAEVLRRHPRGPGFKRGLSDTIKDEARAVPRRTLRLLTGAWDDAWVRMAPFDSGAARHRTSGQGSARCRTDGLAQRGKPTFAQPNAMPS